MTTFGRGAIALTRHARLVPSLPLLFGGGFPSDQRSSPTNGSSMVQVFDPRHAMSGTARTGCLQVPAVRGGARKVHGAAVRTGSPRRVVYGNGVQPCQTQRTVEMIRKVSTYIGHVGLPRLSTGRAMSSNPISFVMSWSN